MFDESFNVDNPQKEKGSIDSFKCNARIRFGNMGSANSTQISTTNGKFFDNMTREEAMDLLRDRRVQIGAYLIRPSNWPNDYALSVRFTENAIKHYRIHCPDKNVFFIEEDVTFRTLDELLQHYMFKRSILTEPCQPWPRGIELDRKSLKKGKVIDEGNFGQVFEGVLFENIPVAIKSLKNGSMNTTEFRREAQLLWDLEHKNLINLYGVCLQEEPFWIVTEFMNKGSLLKYLREKGKTLNKAKLLDIAVRIANGMQYLESKNCVHRDLSARNILVGNSNLCVKIADFGMAREVQEHYYKGNSDTAFPIRWTAPEAAGYNRYSTKSDVWSFGILLMELFTLGKSPYEGMTNMEVLKRVSEGYKMPRPPECPVDVYALMKDCWQENPNRRPTFKEIHTKLKDMLAEQEFQIEFKLSW